MIPFLVAAATFAAFLPCLQNGFVWDDRSLLLVNSGFRGLDPERLWWMFTTFHTGPYMPLTWLSYALDHQIWGMNPFGYHLTSLLLHCANGALFYGVSLRLLGKAAGRSAPGLPWAAGLAALLFSVHPLRAESVAWITERRDVLSGFFYLLTLYYYLEYRRRAALACFAASLLAKGSGVALPLVLLIVDAYPLRRQQRERWIRLCWEKMPFAILALAAAAVGVVGQNSSGAIRPGAGLSLDGRLAQSAYGLVFYLVRTLFPFNLLPFYERPKAMGLFEPEFLHWTGAACVLTAAFWAVRRPFPMFLAAWGAYAVTLAPVLGLVPIGLQLVADRYSYLACLPWPILAAGGLLRGGFSRLGRGLAAASLMALSVMTWRQSQLWKNEETLWTYAARIGGHAYAYNKLGNAMITKGRTTEAIQAFESALRADSMYANAAFNIGVALAGQGKTEEALDRYRETLRLDPHMAAAHVNIAAILAARGKRSEAFAELEAAVRADPNYAPARVNLGSFLAYLGRKAEAEAQFREALRLNPANREARLGLEALNIRL